MLTTPSRGVHVAMARRKVKGRLHTGSSQDRDTVRCQPHKQEKDEVNSPIQTKVIKQDVQRP